MNAKQWIKTFLLLSLFAFGCISLINYIIDPLWTFNHTNRFNRIQEGFNERQQKSNYVYFHKLNQFDGIMLGSSRTTFINQYDFSSMKIYNYAFNSTYPFEYKKYIDFAKKNRKTPLKYIIIGLDFYGTNVPNIKKIGIYPPEHYFNNTISFLYRYKMLLLKDTLKKSLTNMKNSLSNYKQHGYSRDNIKYNIKVSEEERVKNYRINIKRHVKEMSGKNYTYNENYIYILKQLKIDNPHTKFIIFSSPITADLLVSTIKNGDRFKEYERWLKETISVFGEIHHFMTINTITKNLQNYIDDDHYYPFVGTLLAHKIIGQKDNNIPKDFGILLNNRNIDKFLRKFQNELKKY
jgi:hypothetical protein